MSEKAKTELRGHWRHVTEASGQAFGPSGLDREGFVYDTDPAARAVVLMRRRAPGAELAFLERLQRAFYAGGTDITDPEALGALATELGQDAEAFAAALAEDEVKQETWRDYAVSRGAGVSGFPVLIMGPQADKSYVALARGFRPKAEVLPLIAQRLAQAAA
jgi:putative protein-disulfide isomerase